MSASDLFNKGMDAEYDAHDLALAIDLYKQAAEAYEKEGLPADAASCRAMVVILNEKIKREE